MNRLHGFEGLAFLSGQVDAFLKVIGEAVRLIERPRLKVPRSWS